MSDSIGSANNLFVENVISVNGTGSVGFGFSNSVNNTLINSIISTLNAYISTDENSTGNNMTNTTFLAINGGLRFPQTLVMANGTDVSISNLNITFNKNFLNSTELSFLNTSAEITLKGINFVNPLPFVDFNDDGNFEACNPPQCTEISFRGGNFVFDVLSFSSYSSRESFVPTPSAAPDVSVGAGCPPQYVCVEWGECQANGIQERICSDALCGFPDKIEEQSCVYVAPAPEVPEKVEVVVPVVPEETVLNKLLRAISENVNYVVGALIVLAVVVYAIKSLVLDRIKTKARKSRKRIKRKAKR